MARRGPASIAIGLDGAADERIDSWAPAEGIELLSARLRGQAYARHRHDTYAICVTDRGIQAFDYRGRTRISLAGQVVVLHPDEAHDGRAGSDEGFAYRMVYVAPQRIAEAARALAGRTVALPFARKTISTNRTLVRAVNAAFGSVPDPLEPLAADALIEALTRGLMQLDGSHHPAASLCDHRRLERARQFLEAERTRIVTSAELERIAGLDRFQLARQFRRRYGTSPYRYLLMRRLDLVRQEIRTGTGLAEIALAAGFADQAHMSRSFKAAYGLTPAQFRAASR